MESSEADGLSPSYNTRYTITLIAVFFVDQRRGETTIYRVCRRQLIGYLDRKCKPSKKADIGLILCLIGGHDSPKRVLHVDC